MTAIGNEGTGGKPDEGPKNESPSEPMSTDAWEKELADMKDGFKPASEVPGGPVRRPTPPPGGFKVPPLPGETDKPASTPPAEQTGKEIRNKATMDSKKSTPTTQKTADRKPAKSTGTGLSEDKKQKTPVKTAARKSDMSPKFSKVRLTISILLFAIIGLSVGAGYYFRAKRGVEYYIERLRSENVAVQNHASEALKDAGAVAVPNLVELLKEGNEREVLAAAKTLGKIDASESMAVLRTLTSHENPEVRRIALSVLGERAAPETFENVTEQLKSGDQNTRAWAIQALAGYDPKKSVPVLLELLDDENWRVQNTAAKTLQVITGQRLGTPKSSYSPELNKEIRDKWQKWWEENQDTFKRPASPEDKGC